MIETISVLKFPQVQGSLQLARKVALDQVAYENEARGLKSLKILASQSVQSVTKVQSVDGNHWRVQILGSMNPRIKYRLEV